MFNTYYPKLGPPYNKATTRRIVIPKLPPPEELEYECGECGMVFKANAVMGYVCSHERCPVFPRVTCSRDTPIAGGWL